jgi:hypothetical protein
MSAIGTSYKLGNTSAYAGWNIVILLFTGKPKKLKFIEKMG